MNMVCSVLNDPTETISAKLLNLIDFKQMLKEHVWSGIFHKFLCANVHSNEQCIKMKNNSSLKMTMNSNFNVFNEHYRWKDIYLVYVSMQGEVLKP